MASEHDQPVAWRYVLHMEGGQVRAVLSDVNRSPFGVPGEDHSEEYAVTCEPLYRRPAPSRPNAADALEAIIAWNVISAAEWHKRWPQWSRLSTVEEVAKAALTQPPSPDLQGRE